MKEIVTAGLFLILFLNPVEAQETPFSLTFGWEYSVDQLARVKEWRLYSNDKETGSGWVVASVPYDGSGASSYMAPVPLSIKGNPGTKTTRWFSMTAIGKDGRESPRSNVVSYTFDMPPEVSAPFNLTIKTMIQSTTEEAK